MSDNRSSGYMSFIQPIGGWSTVGTCGLLHNSPLGLQQQPGPSRVVQNLVLATEIYNLHLQRRSMGNGEIYDGQVDGQLNSESRTVGEMAMRVLAVMCKFEQHICMLWRTYLQIFSLLALTVLYDHTIYLTTYTFNLRYILPIADRGVFHSVFFFFVRNPTPVIQSAVFTPTNMAIFITSKIQILLYGKSYMACMAYV